MIPREGQFPGFFVHFFGPMNLLCDFLSTRSHYRSHSIARRQANKILSRCWMWLIRISAHNNLTFQSKSRSPISTWVTWRRARISWNFNSFTPRSLRSIALDQLGLHQDEMMWLAYILHIIFIGLLGVGSDGPLSLSWFDFPVPGGSKTPSLSTGALERICLLLREAERHWRACHNDEPAADDKQGRQPNREDQLWTNSRDTWDFYWYNIAAHRSSIFDLAHLVPLFSSCPKFTCTFHIRTKKNPIRAKSSI